VRFHGEIESDFGVLLWGGMVVTTAPDLLVLGVVESFEVTFDLAIGGIKSDQGVNDEERHQISQFVVHFRSPLGIAF
jgi:hypothetical protein